MKRYNTFFISLALILVIGCADREEARWPVSRASGSFLKQSIEMNKEIVADEEEIFDSIMRANADRDYFLSRKGYWFTYLKKSETENYRPAVGDLVYFDSEIMSVTGDTIYREGEIKTREYMVDKENILIGLRDGIKKMKKGEKVQFLFPSHVAYGYLGDKNRIGMNVPVLYTVTLLDIKKLDKENPIKIN